MTQLLANNLGIIIVLVATAAGFIGCSLINR